jgi:hypothetical protein
VSVTCEEIYRRWLSVRGQGLLAIDPADATSVAPVYVGKCTTCAGSKRQPWARSPWTMYEAADQRDNGYALDDAGEMTRPCRPCDVTGEQRTPVAVLLSVAVTRHEFARGLGRGRAPSRSPPATLPARTCAAHRVRSWSALGRAPLAFSLDGPCVRPLALRRK